MPRETLVTQEYATAAARLGEIKAQREALYASIQPRLDELNEQFREALEDRQLAIMVATDNLTLQDLFDVEVLVALNKMSWDVPAIDRKLDALLPQGIYARFALGGWYEAGDSGSFCYTLGLQIPEKGKIDDANLMATVELVDAFAKAQYEAVQDTVTFSVMERYLSERGAHYVRFDGAAYTHCLNSSDMFTTESMEDMLRYLSKSAYYGSYPDDSYDGYETY